MLMIIHSFEFGQSNWKFPSNFEDSMSVTYHILLGWEAI